MYLQITNRCNFRCGHCCFSCTSQGEDISLETAEAALTANIYTQKELTIGGGEPTIHPNFKEIVALAKQVIPQELVYVISNGSNLDLLYWMEDQGIKFYVSNSPWHRSRWSKEQTRYMDNFPQRVVTHKDLSFMGRAKQYQGEFTGDTCFDIHVHPNGNVALCSCPDSPVLGKVWEAIVIPHVVREMKYFCWSDYKRMIKMNGLKMDDELMALGGSL